MNNSSIGGSLALEVGVRGWGFSVRGLLDGLEGFLVGLLVGFLGSLIGLLLFNRDRDWLRDYGF